MATNVPSLKGALKSAPKGGGKVVQQGQGIDSLSSGGHPSIQDERLAKQTIGRKSTINSQPASD